MQERKDLVSVVDGETGNYGSVDQRRPEHEVAIGIDGVTPAADQGREEQQPIKPCDRAQVVPAFSRRYGLCDPCVLRRMRALGNRQGFRLRRRTASSAPGTE